MLISYRNQTDNRKEKKKKKKSNPSEITTSTITLQCSHGGWGKKVYVQDGGSGRIVLIYFQATTNNNIFFIKILELGGLRVAWNEWGIIYRRNCFSGVYFLFLFLSVKKKGEGRGDLRGWTGYCDRHWERGSLRKQILMIPLDATLRNTRPSSTMQ